VPHQPTHIAPEDLSPEDREYFDTIDEFVAQFGPCPDCNCPVITLHGVDHVLRLVRCDYCSHVYWSET
jgi:hypothetical protein